MLYNWDGHFTKLISSSQNEMNFPIELTVVWFAQSIVSNINYIGQRMEMGPNLKWLIFRHSFSNRQIRQQIKCDSIIKFSGFDQETNLNSNFVELKNFVFILIVSPFIDIFQPKKYWKLWQKKICGKNKLRQQIRHRWKWQSHKAIDNNMVNTGLVIVYFCWMSERAREQERERVGVASPWYHFDENNAFTWFVFVMRC